MTKKAMTKKASLTDTTSPAFLPATSEVQGIPATVKSETVAGGMPVNPAHAAKQAAKQAPKKALKKSKATRKSTRGKRAVKRLRAGL